MTKGAVESVGQAPRPFLLAVRFCRCVLITFCRSLGGRVRLFMVPFWRYPFLDAADRQSVVLNAQVVELVDTQVSEACALTACEFESRLGHHFENRGSDRAKEGLRRPRLSLSRTRIRAKA